MFIITQKKDCFTIEKTLNNNVFKWKFDYNNPYLSLKHLKRFIVKDKNINGRYSQKYLEYLKDVKKIFQILKIK